MKESSSLHPDEARTMPDQFRNALASIRSVLKLLDEKGEPYILEYVSHQGEECLIKIDIDFINMMIGGARRIYSDMIDLGKKSEADRIIDDISLNNI